VIRHSVVIGVLRRGDGDDKPTIGDRVELGPRACVVGGVTIGDDSFVCANTVVPINVPARSTVLGVPARIVDLDRQLAVAS
jgi:serine O-acetyltransferase